MRMRGLERVGGRFVAATALLLAVAGNAAFAQEHKTYRCKVVDENLPLQGG